MGKDTVDNIDNLVNSLNENNIKYNMDELNIVLEFAKKIYKENERFPGISVYEHCIGVAIICSTLNLDSTSIYAAILHETVKYKKDVIEEIKEKFSEEIAELVNGISKLRYLNYADEKLVDSENLRNMFMAIAKDVRVVIIKLADRLYNLRKIKNDDSQKAKEKAYETLEIYTPIAHRLGISNIKSELEDIAFKISYKEEYKKIKKSIDSKKKEREEYIDSRIKEITDSLKENNVEATIYGRPKHFYSIYKKTKEKNCEVEDLFDLLAIRIIVNSIKDCYMALGIVHDMYKPMPGRFKDYIAVPKTNMYQSLHTTVFGVNKIPFEIQIRTWDMHKVADYGVAAHFLYKEKSNKLSKTDEKLLALRQKLEFPSKIVDINNESAKEEIQEMKMELFGEEVFVFTPKGEIKSLPKGSTTVDFAYFIHQKIAEKMVGAKINGKMVPINTVLKNTDVVEIVTSSNVKGPSRDWLKFVKTNSAKNKIMSFLKKQGKEENIERGRELFEKEIKRHKQYKDEMLKEEFAISVFKKLNLNTFDDVYENIGFGSISPVKVVNRLLEEYKKKYLSDEITKDILKKGRTKSNKIDDVVKVHGIDNCLVKFAKCCNPIPGDEIIGYITYGNGVSIHTKDCSNLKGLDTKNRLIEVFWKNKIKTSFSTHIRIVANDRDGLMQEILKKLQDMKVEISNINSKKTNTKENITELVITVMDSEMLQKVTKELRKIDSVYDVKRLK